MSAHNFLWTTLRGDHVNYFTGNLDSTGGLFHLNTTLLDRIVSVRCGIITGKFITYRDVLNDSRYSFLRAAMFKGILTKSINAVCDLIEYVRNTSTTEIDIRLLHNLFLQFLKTSAVPLYYSI